jgi:hypothetical protein
VNTWPALVTGTESKKLNRIGVTGFATKGNPIYKSKCTLSRGSGFMHKGCAALFIQLCTFSKKNGVVNRCSEHGG